MLTCANREKVTYGSKVCSSSLIKQVAVGNMDASYQIRKNAQDYRDFVASLGSFEEEMKLKDAKARLQKLPQKHLPIHGSSTSETPHTNGNATKPNALGGLAGAPKESNRIRATDYSAWDKFDVDAAVDDVENQPATAPIPDAASYSPRVDPQVVEHALIEKEKGNAFFKKAEYKKALVCYNKSIQLDANVVVFVNRAMVYLKLGMYAEAEHDCTAGLSVDAKNVKALWRRGMARFELGKYHEAKRDLNAALVLEPGNKSIKTDFDRCVLALDVTTSSSKLNTPQPSRPEAPKPRRRIPIQEIGEPMHPDGNKPAPRKRPAITTSSSGTTESSPVSQSELLEPSAPISMVQEILAERDVELPSRPSHAVPLPHSSATANTPLATTITADPAPKHALPLPATTPLLPKVSAPLPPRSSSTARASSHTAPAKTTPPCSLSSAPRNLLEFEREWKGLRHDSHRAFAFLKTINPSQLPAIFKSGLESAYLSRMLEVVAETFTGLEGEYAAAFEFMEMLAKVPRFHMLVMFMSKSDKQALDTIFGYLHEGERGGVIFNVVALRNLYY
ncbi:hypothetical protein SeMB42_g05817 [Synchytrium endobioticum]|uniref:RNA polymerase II-associated protein 3 n=1 Tax=Synchytrium endobioticum TaxID=286115 RepID=A0A507CP37_9FUNG|nr:hypothetical protein SeLEV6574_g06584 [Synchytrium endobioticum]TPX40909.1 hypothetical protein SeMB42_g05817 [Synchytrium endobioticum]